MRVTSGVDPVGRREAERHLSRCRARVGVLAADGEAWGAGRKVLLSVEFLCFNGINRRTGTMTAYCVKCKSKREMQEGQKVTMKNGRPAMKGKCPVCGTGLYRILPSS